MRIKKFTNWWAPLFGWIWPSDHHRPLRVLLLNCALLLLLLPAITLGDEPEKNVLLLYSDDLSLPANALITNEIRTTFRERWKSPIQIYDEGQDSFRIPSEKYDVELVRLLQKKYESVHFDLIFALGPPALRFLLQHQSELFTDTPIVYFVTDPSRIADLSPGPKVTGVSTRVEVAPTLELALTLQPQTQNVVVVSGNAPINRGLLGVAQREFRAYEGKVAFTYLTDLTPEEMRQRLAALPANTIVIYLGFSADRTGRVYNSNEVGSLLAASANAPTYGPTQVLLGHGIVGGQLLSFEALGLAGAQMGLRVLAGESPQNIAPQTLSSVAMFDWRELRRWQIAESRLPPGSVVRFKEFSVWELYKWRIIGAISLIIFQSVLIVGLLMTRAKRRQAEKDNERLARVAEADRRRLDEVVSNVPGIVWEVRAEPGTNLRRATFVSEYVEKLLGYTVDEWLATPGFALSIIPEEDRERSSREAQALFESGKDGVLQFKWRTKDGRLIWVESQFAPVVDETGQVIGIRGVTMDITERKQTEEALRESEHRFQLVSQATKDILYEWNLDTGFVWWNDSAMRSVFGYPLEEMRHDFNWWEERLHPEDRDRIGVSVTQALRGVERMWESEYRFRKMDNSYAHVYHRAFIVRGHRGQALKVIGSLMDFTERKQSEEKLRWALEEVRGLKNQLQEENIYLQEEIKLAHSVDEIIGRSNAIKYVLFKVEQVSKTDSTVLVLGETGTGKELVARAIHSQSRRKDRPLVKVNCAALSASLIESELFGHEKGAFTGASMRKVGRFEVADGATLFLDEIGELPLDLQSKLLRVIQEGEFERLGSSKTVKVDVRIIAATNRNMKEEVEKGRFREDLWYRLNVFPITVPPLRQRTEDIPPMVEHFVSNFSRKVGKDINAVSSVTLKKLENYSWPGNVRELANIVERAVINARGPVLHIADKFEETAAEEPSSPNKTLEEIEREYIVRILDDNGWRIEGPSGAARVLGLNPSTLRTRMIKLGIQKSMRASNGDWI